MFLSFYTFFLSCREDVIAKFSPLASDNFVAGNVPFADTGCDAFL